MSRVSIIIPAFNARATIARAIASALGQRGVEPQVIVVDDGSRDDTLRVASDALAHASSAVIDQLGRNSGVSAARNRGLALAKGAFVMFLDADDTLEPNAASMLLEAATGRGAGAAAGGFEVIGKDNTVLHVHRQRDDRFGLDTLIDEAVLVTPALLFDRGAIGELRFDETLTLYEDRDLWLRIAERGVRFAGVPAPVAHYRVTPGSLSKAADGLAAAAIGVLDACVRRQRELPLRDRLADADGARLDRARSQIALDYATRSVVASARRSAVPRAVASLGRHAGGALDAEELARAAFYACVFHRGTIVTPDDAAVLDVLGAFWEQVAGAGLCTSACSAEAGPALISLARERAAQSIAWTADHADRNRTPADARGAA